MKKVYSNAESMAHIWANGDFSINGFKGGNAYADYNKFYSYSTVIGIVINNALIYTTSRYSNTTSKHQQILKSSFWGKKIAFNCRINSYCYGTSLDIKSLMLREKEELSNKINILLDKQSKAKSVNYLEKVEILVSDYNSKVDYFSTGEKIEMDLSQFNEKILQMKEKNKLKALEKKEETKKFNDLYLPQLKGLKKDLLHMWRVTGGNFNYSKKEVIDATFKDVSWNMRSKLLKKFDELLNGDYIRLSGDNIVTNRFATVSKKEALLVLNCIDNKENCKGLKVGNYTLLSVAGDFVKIGCHNFSITDNIEILRGIKC